MIVIEKQGAVLAAYDPEYRAPLNRRHPKRGDVTAFTRKSRRRMLLFMNRMDFTARCTFLTLTFHGDPTVSQSNKALKRFIQRLNRKFPGASAVWRRELQPQRAVIHFHLLIFNMPFWDQRDLQLVWSACTREDRSIVWVKLLYGRRAAMAYVSKYIAKALDEPEITSLDICPYQPVPRKRKIGRSWGYINADALPLAQAERVAVVDDGLTAWLWRAIREKTHGRCGQDPHIVIMFGEEAGAIMLFIRQNARVIGELPPETGKICYNRARARLCA